MSTDHLSLQLFPYTTLFRSGRRAVEAPVAGLNQARIGRGAIAAGKAVECGQRPGEVRLEHHPVVIGSAVIRRAVEAPVARLGQRSEEHTSELQSRGHLVCRL